MKGEYNRFKLILIINFIFITGCISNSDITVINDYDKALINASSQKANMFIVFDLLGSSSNYVQTLLDDYQVKYNLKNYIIVRLMCDDRSLKNEEGSIGSYNAQLQIQMTGKRFQPMFCFAELVDFKNNIYGLHVLNFSTTKLPKLDCIINI